jgi:hypothetical protein
MSLEQANMLLSGAADANDAIRDANNKTTQTWQNTKKTDAREKEGESWYHGVMDTVSGGNVASSAYATSQRMAKLGTSSYGELVSSDLSKVGSKLSSLGQSGGKAITSIGEGIKSAGVSVGAISGKTNLADLSSESMGLSTATDLPTSAETPTPAPTTTPAEPAEPDPLITDDGTKIQTSADVTPAKDISDTTSTTEPTPAPEGEGGGGGVTGKIVNKLSGGAVAEDSIAAEGLGKVAGNIGGAIDIYKDFENIGSKGGFLGGTGASTRDEVGNALTLGGTALDVASMALPFLAPVAAGVQLAGAAVGTYNAIKDADKQTTNDKGNYQGSLINTEVPPSLAGAGFLASAQSDPKKLIGGSSSF